jgi:hypothetical protein
MQSEKTVSVQVTYYLSPAGQRAALAAGLPAAREQTVEVCVPGDLWVALPECTVYTPGLVIDEAGMASLRMQCVRGGVMDSPRAVEYDAHPADLVATVAAWSAEQRAAIDAYAARTEDCRRRYLAGEELSDADEARVPRWDAEVRAERLRREVARWMIFPPIASLDHLGHLVAPPSEARDWPEVAAEFSRRKAEVAARRAALGRVREEEAARNEAAAAAKAAREEAARVWTATWLREHGTPDQQERFADGVLPAAELRQMLTDYFMGELVARFPRFVRMEPHEVCKECLWEPSLYGFSTEPATELTAAQWARRNEIRAALPEGATAEVLVHVGRCADEQHTRVRHGVARRLSVRVRRATPAGVEARVELALPE